MVGTVKNPLSKGIDSATCGVENVIEYILIWSQSDGKLKDGAITVGKITPSKFGFPKKT